MTTPLTDVEKIRRLPWIVAADSLNTGFFLLTFSGSVFILFLNELGLNAGQIGFLLSLVPFCGIIAPFVAPTVARFGYKRTFVTFWGIRNFVFALMLLTPLIVVRFGPEQAFIWVSSILLAFAICRAIAETGGYPWRQEAVPASIRGKFAAINSMSTTVAGIIVVAGASYLIDRGTGLGRFMVLMTIGIGFGLVSIWTYAQVPGGAPVPAGTTGTGHLSGMRQAFRDRDFLFFLGALGLATVGGTSVISFVPLFMKEQVGLSDGNVVVLSVGTYIGALLTSYWWGWVADRYGSRPVMQFSLGLMLFLPIAWFLMPKQSRFSLSLAVIIAFVAGVATLAWQISWIRQLYVNAIPPDKKSPYMALYYAWFGFASGLGPLLAGQVINLSKGLSLEVWLFRLDPYTPLFGLSIILLVTAVAAVSQLRSRDATSFRKLAGMFLRGNPIRAIESLVQYNFSVSEVGRMTITERMGDAKNPLSVNELIEALNDASFNVRYEAIHAIGRMPPEPALVEALLDSLRQGPSELSFVVTRSLGRLGDPRAIEPLRELLCSGYHLLEANSARALAMLGDADSIPAILEKFRNETNETLRIAYISALGTLGSTEAIDEIFGLLRQTEIEVQRGEIGLALARIAGPEQYYMQRWRSLRANPNTATAQAVLALQKPARQAGLEELAALAETCAADYAQNNSSQATHFLQKMIQQIPRDRLDQALARILDQCSHSLADFGYSHQEIILLSLHSLDIALRRLQLPSQSRSNDAERNNNSDEAISPEGKSVEQSKTLT